MIRSTSVFVVYIVFGFSPIFCQVSFAKGTGTTEECLEAKARYFANTKIQISCAPYVHIYHSAASVQKLPIQSTLKVGQFNVLRLGEESSRFKDFGLLAKIINQWDIVGTVELTPTKEAARSHNNRLDNLTRTSQVQESYLAPGHIRLLLALQALDPSWSLMMSAEARGEGSSGELAGFYYRATLLTPAATKYCATLTGEMIAEGCTARFSESIDPLISRPPFIGSFQVGTRFYTMVTSHIRFDSSVEEKQALLKLFPGNCGTRCPSTSEFQPRFAEAKATAELIAQLEKIETHAVIWGGDFNFSPTDARGMSLQFILSPLDGGQMLNTQPTSLAKDTGLSKSYDHFILSKAGLSECDPTSVSPFDFRNSQLLPEVSSYQSRADQLFEQFKELWSKQITVKSRTIHPLMNSHDVAKASANFDEWIRNPDSPNQLFRAILSDHLPISMSCKTN